MCGDSHESIGFLDPAVEHLFVHLRVNTEIRRPVDGGRIGVGIRPRPAKGVKQRIIPAACLVGDQPEDRRRDRRITRTPSEGTAVKVERVFPIVEHVEALREIAENLLPFIPAGKALSQKINSTRIQVVVKSGFALQI